MTRATLGRTSALGGLQLDPEYGELEGVLRFSDLASTEDSILRLEEFRQRFGAAGDKKGVEECRKVALAGRRRAEALARSGRVRAAKSLDTDEDALWFQTWLENPALFRDWLELRKRSAEFQHLFGASYQELPDGGRK